MSEDFPAFDISPVPEPTNDAEPPELFRGLYGMPMFVTVPSANLEMSVDFWCRGLGFFDLFAVPDEITHLRRWAFQDVLLVPGSCSADARPLTVSFSCVVSQIESIETACAQLLPGCVSEPRKTPWNTIDLHIRTPENVQVIMTAARPYIADNPEAENLRAMGIEGPAS